MRGRRLVLLVAGALLALLGFGATAGGAILLWAHATQRDADGFYTTSTERLDTSSYALTAEVDFGSDPSQRGWVPDHPVGTVRIRAASPAGEIFVGIAPTAAVDRWLDGVAHERVRELDFGPFRPHTTLLGGPRIPRPPGVQPFWVAAAEGPGRQTVVWPSEEGRWSAVVMNADARRDVTVDVSVGARTGLLLPVGAGIGLGGLLALGGGIALMVLALRRHEASAADLPPPVPTVGVYPARLDGHLDEPLSRWRWLFKWLLLLPHLVVLAFLWLAVVALTVLAGIAVLFTGRYPRSMFDFNVGVMRWSWRVAFYGLSAFGTDRYPPFSLDPDPTYPADFTVDYPERLSRPLVLVKWWLLALPHYVVVGILAGGWGWGWDGGDSFPLVGGGGLISVLALVAGVVLAVRRRYPEPLFDLLMGLNRWCFRVLAYAALLRDEYPPFRLDPGGADPGSVLTVPESPAPLPAEPR